MHGVCIRGNWDTNVSKIPDSLNFSAPYPTAYPRWYALNSGQGHGCFCDRLVSRLCSRTFRESKFFNVRIMTGLPIVFAWHLVIQFCTPSISSGDRPTRHVPIRCFCERNFTHTSSFWTPFKFFATVPFCCEAPDTGSHVHSTEILAIESCLTFWGGLCVKVILTTYNEERSAWVACKRVVFMSGIAEFHLWRFSWLWKQGVAAISVLGCCVQHTIHSVSEELH